MNNHKSPFLVEQDFISPLLCEEIVDELDLFVPDRDKDGKALPSIRTNKDYEAHLFELIEPKLQEVAAYYGGKHRATTEFAFEWYPTGAKGELHAENSQFSRGKWLRTKGRDVSGVIFLSDYNDAKPFDDDYEVYGGKLEFPQHGFGFQAQRGCLVMFPSDPHFINSIAQVSAGSLYLVRFHIALENPLMYNPELFPGSFSDWFQAIA